MVTTAILLINAFSIYGMAVSVPPGTSYGAQQQTTQWSTVPKGRAKGEAAVKGLHEASVVRVRIFDGPQTGVPMVIWNDGQGFGGSTGGGPREGGYFRGEQRLPNGNVLRIEANTVRHGKSATVVVGEKTYDLKNGGLFLVATQGASVRVKQPAP